MSERKPYLTAARIRAARQTSNAWAAIGCVASTAACFYMGASATVTQGAAIAFALSAGFAVGAVATWLESIR